MTVPQGKHIVPGLVIGVVLAAIAGGFFILGSPAEQRLLQLDVRRVSDLIRISSEIDVYWTRQKRLPATMEELARQPGPSRSFRDPATAALYEYRALNDSTYELGATFQRDSAREPYGQAAGFWSHGAGKQRFELKARIVSPSAYYRGPYHPPGR